jgi:hypothetical protein
MSDKIEIPPSTKWEVGLSVASFIIIVIAMIVTFSLNTPVNLDEATVFTKVVVIGSVLGGIFAVAVVAFNIVIFAIAAFGAVIFAGAITLWDILTGKKKNDSS